MSSMYALEQIYATLEQIAETSSRNEKEKILASVKGKDFCDDFIAVLKWTYSPKIDFYIKDLKDIEKSGRFSLEYCQTNPNAKHYTQVLASLSNREVTGNEARQLVSDFIISNDVRVGEVFKRIIKRDLRAGISAKTINKVFPNLIYEHPYMRCSVLDNKTISKISYPCISQLKLDGMYVDIVVNNGKVTYMSRKGSILPFNNEQNDSKLLSFADGYVIQGEALVSGESSGGVEEILTRTEGNGYLNSDEVDTSIIRFVVWDMIPLADFERKKCTIPYIERLAKIENVYYHINALFLPPSDTKFLTLAETQICKNFDEVVEHFKTVRSEGLEGTVIKNNGAIWKDGTSNDQLKFKVIAECELKVVGFNEGEGKNIGLVGSLICQSSDGKIEVSVSGFTDSVRKSITNGIDTLIEEGAIITVKYNDILKKEGEEKLSLFLPRFVKFRLDKNDADPYEVIRSNLDSFEFSL